MGITELVILIIIVGIPVVIIASRKKQKPQKNTKTSVLKSQGEISQVGIILGSQESTKTTTIKRPPGATALGWAIIAETILEFGSGIFDILPLLQSSNTTAIEIRNFLLLYEIGVSVLKLLIAIGLFKGINLARWSWVVFGLLLFGLNEWNAWRALGVMPGQNAVSNVSLITEFLKYFWIGTLFFLFKSNMNTYFKGFLKNKANYEPHKK